MAITEKGHWSSGTLTERGRIVTNSMTEQGQMVFGVTVVTEPPSFDFFAIKDRSTLIKIMLLQGGRGMYMVGSGYLGSDSLLTSTENQEIIPLKSTNPDKTYSLYKLSFYNDQSCHVLINNETTLYLRAGQGFNSDVGDKNITSFKIVEAGVTYNWAGAF